MDDLKNNTIYVVFDVNTHEIIYYSNNADKAINYLYDDPDKDNLDWRDINLMTVIHLIYNK